MNNGVHTSEFADPQRFDLADHYRRRIRTLERENQALKERERQLYRVMAALLVTLFEDTDVDPFEYLNRLVAVDDLKAELGL